MQNKNQGGRIYRASAIKDILRIARERSCQAERRTKKWLAEELGITTVRLTGIEQGTSQVPLDLAIAWCDAVGDKVAKQKILYIYGVALPPTDPRLLESVPAQFINFQSELREAIDQIEIFKQVYLDIRPGRPLKENHLEVAKRAMKQVMDVKQASQCLSAAVEKAIGISVEQTMSSWVQQAVADGVVMRSIDDYEDYAKDRMYEEHVREFLGAQGVMA
ncbi:helix-turn-helix domain-containing protein [Aureibacillus halotolerans]|uniref:Helix-turn-helix protein n=1 Tax=Aureibacillus halotolerans TaxID=1508390 RepID=A0A4R6TQL9_9BACI|nr:helix-turn-helix domain-containing protein [Aureibacillus halotolerans]TDQ35239.1 hypothetical protein EV213_12226 [Aureibacillus halotolerans]